jgi:predicted RNA-binding Zn ribbon-like protein
MPLHRLTPAAFELCGGHPALDLVNSLGDRFLPGHTLERLTDYGTLLRFTVDVGLLDSRRARQLAQADGVLAERAVRAARELREALAAALYAHVEGRAIPAPELRTLERWFQRAARHRELSAPRADGALQWDWGRFGNRVELPVWLLAQSAAELVTSTSLSHVSACGDPTCAWLFLDTSRNHSRRWCDMKVCGNRMKARRFQARHES